ncbi:hypothetical protein DFH08DRAFT_660515, partial [Mycena albidolilacea]
MAYTWYEEDIVQRYNVVLVGWTPAKFVNPSELSTSLEGLRTLLQALKDGKCFFKKLSPAEAAARKRAWEEKVAKGLEVAKHRAGRSDQGIPRKRAQG